jgi:hypothetical protein
MRTLVKIEVPHEQYLALKKSVLGGEEFMRVDIDLKEIKIKTLKKIELNIKDMGITREVGITKQAMTEMVELLGMKKSFYDTILTSFDEDTELVGKLVAAIRGTKQSFVTMVYNQASNKITKVYYAGSKHISDSQFFESLENLIKNTPGSYLRNIVVYPNANYSAVIANPGLTFQYGNSPDEEFSSGMTLEMIDNKMMCSFFVERLICSNGNMIKDKLCTRSVHTSNEIPSFIEALGTQEFHINSVAAFKARLSRVYNTRASVAEVLEAERRVINTINDDVAKSVLMNKFCGERIRGIVGQDFIDNNKDLLRYVRTDLSVWQLVNQITSMSSYIEQNRMKVDPFVNRGLQVIGGQLLFSNPDLPPSNVPVFFRD